MCFNEAANCWNYTASVIHEWIIMEHRWNDGYWGNPEVCREELFSISLSTTNSTRTWFGRNWRNLVSETSVVLHTQFLFVLTRVLVHRCRIWGQESRFDNFEYVSYAQNVKVVTGRLFAQKTQTWERLLMCCVWQRPRNEDTESIKCRGWVVSVCIMKACRRHKGIAPLILNGCTGRGECKHHVPAFYTSNRTPVPV